MMLDKRGGRFKDLAGQTFGRLTVIGLESIRGKKFRAYWLCKCACGNTKVCRADTLTRGVTTSCRCFQKECARALLKTHGQTGTRTHITWMSLRRRCHNSTDEHYPNYGGRGIKVCDRWEKFENFFADMGERPEGKTLDRIDNDGDYTPENCRWASPREQANNTRDTYRFMFEGKLRTLRELADRTGLNLATLRGRAYRGVTGARLFAPTGS